MESCKWARKNHLVWATECKHQIGTPRSWEPKGKCMCCGKLVDVLEEDTVEAERLIEISHTDHSPIVV